MENQNAEKAKSKPKPIGVFIKIYPAFTGVLVCAASFFVVWIFTATLSTDKLLRKNLRPTTNQDSLLRSSAAYILHQDPYSISYTDTLKKDYGKYLK